MFLVRENFIETQNAYITSKMYWTSQRTLNGHFRCTLTTLADRLVSLNQCCTQFKSFGNKTVCSKNSISFKCECCIILWMKHTKNLNPERFELGSALSSLNWSMPCLYIQFSLTKKHGNPTKTWNHWIAPWTPAFFKFGGAKRSMPKSCSRLNPMFATVMIVIWIKRVNSNL